MKEVRGIRNNNPLNIRKGSTWKGERPTQVDREFEEFVSIEWGVRAGLKLIRNHIAGFGGSRQPMNTIYKLISVWAPPCENNTRNYVRTVSLHTGLLPSEIIKPNDRKMICAIARAMAFVECGVWLDPEIFFSAWDLL